MRTATSIIVGIDFSPGSAAALTHAIRIAKLRSVTLRLFHALPKLVVTDLAETLGRNAAQLEPELIEDARKQLEELLPGDVDRDQVSCTVRVGQPLDELLAEARREPAQLLVLGVTGESGGSHGAGTFAKKCIRNAPTDVLLVHDRHSGPFRSVVVGTDFSPTSERALAAAAEVAQTDGSKLHAVHVYYGPWHKLHYRSPTLEAAPEFRQQYLTRLQRLLEGFVDARACGLNGLDCQTHLLEDQSYGRGIVECSTSHDADLIVLGTLGTSNLRYMLLGSTAERVLRETRCSVLAVRASQTAA